MTELKVTIGADASQAIEVLDVVLQRLDDIEKKLDTISKRTSEVVIPLNNLTEFLPIQNQDI